MRYTLYNNQYLTCPNATNAYMVWLSINFFSF